MKPFLLVVKRYQSSSFYQFSSRENAETFAKELEEKYKLDTDPIRSWEILSDGEA